MSDENVDPDSTTIEILTYTAETDVPTDVPSIDADVQPKKPKKRKMSIKTPRTTQHESYDSSMKTFVYCKTYYRQKLRSLLRFMNETNRLEAKVLSCAGGSLTTNEQADNNPLYFTVHGRRFLKLTNLQ